MCLIHIICVAPTRWGCVNWTLQDDHLASQKRRYPALMRCLDRREHSICPAASEYSILPVNLCSASSLNDNAAVVTYITYTDLKSRSNCGFMSNHGILKRPTSSLILWPFLPCQRVHVIIADNWYFALDITIKDPQFTEEKRNLHGYHHTVM